MKKLSFAVVLILAALSAVGLSACGGSVTTATPNYLSYDDAVRELEAFNQEIPVKEAEAPLDIYSDETSVDLTLADIDTFPITVKGSGDIDIEIAGATEMTANAPDDWLNVVAERFNREGLQIDGRTVSVSVRKITSGEVVTYMTNSDYQPDVYIPSSYAWGEMLKAEGVSVKKLTDRIIGNTAGILMEQSVYDEFINKYQEVTVDKVLEASLAGDMTFAYTNPYTSSTGLNILTAMLHAFDSNNPLSDTAAEKLLDYQRQSPPVAYTTAVLREQAAKGIIKAMVMEEQAYHNTPELRDYVYTPAGIRHDHPVYTFGYVSKEKQAAAELFVEYCLSDEAQQLAEEKGFNLHNDYQEQSPGLDGAGFLAAQKIWKQNKDGGKPIIAVFVADVSGSMDGLPLNSLKSSLLSTSSYISDDNYIGLVSYSNRGNISVNLPIEQFDSTQRAKFSGAVKALTANGSTATYDAVMVALKMMLDKQAEVPDAKLMLFVLSDGDQNDGFTLERIKPVVGGLQVPVYTIGYNLSGGRAENELEELSGINEAALINAKSEDLVNQLRNLFNVQL